MAKIKYTKLALHFYLEELKRVRVILGEAAISTIQFFRYHHVLSNEGLTFARRH
jgi:hypothetical protein